MFCSVNNLQTQLQTLLSLLLIPLPVCDWSKISHGHYTEQQLSALLSECDAQGPGMEDFSFSFYFEKEKKKSSHAAFFHHRVIYLFVVAFNSRPLSLFFTVITQEPIIFT